MWEYLKWMLRKSELENKWLLHSVIRACRALMFNHKSLKESGELVPRVTYLKQYTVPSIPWTPPPWLYIGSWTRLNGLRRPCYATINIERGRLSGTGGGFRDSTVHLTTILCESAKQGTVRNYSVHHDLRLSRKHLFLHLILSAFSKFADFVLLFESRSDISLPQEP